MVSKNFRLWDFGNFGNQVILIFWNLEKLLKEFFSIC